MSQTIAGTGFAEGKFPKSAADFNTLCDSLLFQILLLVTCSLWSVEKKRRHSLSSVSAYRLNVLCCTAQCAAVLVLKNTLIAWRSAPIKLVLQTERDLRHVHYSTDRFKLNSTAAVFIYRQAPCSLNPSTPLLEVTRWHQTCICENAFALHRLCQLMFAF